MNSPGIVDASSEGQIGESAEVLGFAFSRQWQNAGSPLDMEQPDDGLGLELPP